MRVLTPSHSRGVRREHTEMKAKTNATIRRLTTHQRAGNSPSSVDLQARANHPSKSVKHNQQSQLTKTVFNLTLLLCQNEYSALILLMRRRARDGTSAPRSRRQLGPSPGRKPQRFKHPHATTRPRPLSNPIGSARRRIRSHHAHQRPPTSEPTPTPRAPSLA